MARVRRAVRSPRHHHLQPARLGRPRRRRQYEQPIGTRAVGCAVGLELDLHRSCRASRFRHQPSVMARRSGPLVANGGYLVCSARRAMQ